MEYKKEDQNNIKIKQRWYNINITNKKKTTNENKRWAMHFWIARIDASRQGGIIEICCIYVFISWEVQTFNIKLDLIVF